MFLMSHFQIINGVSLFLILVSMRFYIQIIKCFYVGLCKPLVCIFYLKEYFIRGNSFDLLLQKINFVVGFLYSLVLGNIAIQYVKTLFRLHCMEEERKKSVVLFNNKTFLKTLKPKKRQPNIPERRKKEITWGTKQYALLLNIVEGILNIFGHVLNGGSFLSLLV